LELEAHEYEEAVTVADHSEAPVAACTLDYVVAVWSELLGSAVGPDDNFFERGGHSLLAIQMLARLEDDLGVDATVATLYRNPTPRGFHAGIVGG
jgi:aryl carrier-like protein